MRSLILLLLTGTLTLSSLLAAEDTSPKGKKTVQSILAQAKKIPGYLEIYDLKGKYYLLLNSKEFKQDFLMTASIAHGIGRDGIFGGTMLPTRVIRFRKTDDEVQLLFRHISHIAGKDKALNEALKVAFQDQIFDSFKIIAEHGGKSLIDATTLLGADIYQVATRLSRIYEGSVKHNPKLSHIKEVKNFTENTEVRSNLAFTQRTSLGAVSNFEILMHYSFFGFPKEKYQPRDADQRIGNFLTALKDFSIIEEPEPFRRYVNRWNLQKADPKARASLPKKPIIYYLARTIPHKYRRILREGILEWNKAFEQIGFIGALEARVQMDDEDWDPEDNRYHVVSWITTEKPSYSAIGPSRVNPLTGEILDADILMDDTKIRSKIFEFDRQFGRDKEEIENKPSNVHSWQDQSCHALDAIGEQIGLLMIAEAKANSIAKGEEPKNSSEPPVTKTTNEASDGDEKKPELSKIREEYIMQALKWVIMHEVGHTLGFRHNFKGSTIHKFQDLHNKELAETKGLYGSVMDYPGVNISKDPSKQGYYFTPTLGPYDYWVVEYSYGVFAKGKEKKSLAQIAAKSNLKELAYATDEDTRGREYSDMDPYASLYDLSEDPLEYSEHMIEFVAESWDEIVDRIVGEGESYQNVEKAFFSFIRTYVRSLDNISKFIGGKVFTRIHRGDSKDRPITPISFATQRKALELLDKYAFQDDFLKISRELAESMPSSRWSHWGTDIYGQPIDKNIQKIVAYVQKEPLERLLSPRILERLIDQAELYSDQNDVLTLNEYFNTLMTSVYSEIFPKGFPNVTLSAPLITAARRDLQREFLTVMIDLYNKGKSGTREIPVDGRSLAKRTLRRILYQIDKLRKLKSYDALDPISKIHLEDTFERIEAFLDSRYVLKNN